MSQVGEGWTFMLTGHSENPGGTFEPPYQTLQPLGPNAGSPVTPILVASGLSLGNPAVASNQSTATLFIESPLTHTGFEMELNNRITWMARHNIQSAEIRLNPPNLGPLEVHVSVSKGETHVLFTSPHAAVREALEAAIPRLREGFSDQGLVLGEADVADHSAQDRDANGHQSPAMERGSEHAPTAAESPPGDALASVIDTNGLLDVYV